MKNEITEDTAKSVYVRTETASWMHFFYNTKGDLFINSDYGIYAFSWRAFGDDFEKFLSQCYADYIVGKLESNHLMFTGKKLQKPKAEKLTVLCQAIIDYCKNLTQ